MTEISISWSQIDAWLSAHAPASLALLNPPAADKDIAYAERIIGVAFPGHLRESLSIHDGLSAWGNLLPEQSPLSAVRIAEHWQMCMDIHEPNDEEPGEEPWWHPLWIPWAESDGDAQVIDLRPGPGHGRLGTAVHDDGGDFEHGWPSLAAYLAAVAEALSYGGGVGGWYPYLTHDRQLWWDLGPDQTTLNRDPLTPAPHDGHP